MLKTIFKVLKNRCVQLQSVGSLQVDRFLQLDTYSCGPISLLTVLNYHDYSIDPGKLRRLCNLTKEGSDRKDLITAARSLGFSSRYRTKNISNIREEINNYRPIICVRYDLYGYEEEGHFSVICDYDDDKIFFADPSIRARSTMPIKRIRYDLRGSLVCIKPKGD